MNPQACDHTFDVPLYAATDREWTEQVIGWACSKCWKQVFCDETVIWTATSSTNTYIQVSR